ncbi:DUF1320 domain-containing protein [Pseudomonas qingdaonensis]|nr:DUF1320 domain-containing protein [Pseudomonas qingdaonensis]
MIALITRFGGQELADLAVPKTNRPIDGELLEAAAKGESFDNWDAEEVASAVAGLARIADAATRARSEIQFYLRYRQEGQDAPDWVADDLPELTRFHLYGEKANAESAVRLRYRDIIKRLESLAAEDENAGPRSRANRACRSAISRACSAAPPCGGSDAGRTGRCHSGPSRAS